MDKLAEGSPLTIRLQGPYADPPTPLGQPDAVVLVAGGQLLSTLLKSSLQHYLLFLQHYPCQAQE